MQEAVPGSKVAVPAHSWLESDLMVKFVESALNSREDDSGFSQFTAV